MAAREMTSDTSRVPLPTRLGFVVGGSQTLDPLPTVTSYLENSGGVLVSRPHRTKGQAGRLQEAGRRLDLLVDAGLWRSMVGSPAVTTEADNGLAPLDLDVWAEQIVASTSAHTVFTPTYHVSTADWETLTALLAATAAGARPELVTLIPTGADMLEAPHLDTFLSHLRGTPPRQFAFIFTDSSRPFKTHARNRIKGLRRVLKQHPGAWIIGVDPLIASDAIACGAGLAAVGVSGAARNPAGPNDKGFCPDSDGFLPGLFLPSLLEHRSPRTYAKWFANSAVDTCDECGRRLDSFQCTDADKLAILRHNLHATHALVDALTAREPATQRPWLGRRRCNALAAHLQMNPIAATVDADRTLRALCELDDPQGRLTTPQGAWL